MNGGMPEGTHPRLVEAFSYASASGHLDDLGTGVQVMVSTLVVLLIKAGVFTQEEWQREFAATIERMIEMREGGER